MENDKWKITNRLVYSIERTGGPKRQMANEKWKMTNEKSQTGLSIPSNEPEVLNDKWKMENDKWKMNPLLPNLNPPLPALSITNALRVPHLSRSDLHGDPKGLQGRTQSVRNR